MTLDEIKTLLAEVDPDIRHYWTMGTGADYSFWEETRLLDFTADGHHADAWAFTVHRFTKTEGDPVALALFRALDADPRIAVRVDVDHEPETGYIHHIFSCEGY